MDDISKMTSALEKAPGALRYMLIMKSGRDIFKETYGRDRWKEEILSHVTTHQYSKGRGITTKQLALDFGIPHATANRYIKVLYKEGRLARLVAGQYSISANGFLELINTIETVMNNCPDLLESHVNFKNGT